KSSDEGDDDDEGSDDHDNDDDDQDDANKDDDDQEEGDDDQGEGNDDDQDSDEEGEEFIHPREEWQDEEDDEDKLYRDVNINLEGRGVQVADIHTTQESEDSHVTLTPMDVQPPTTMAPLPLFSPTLTPSTIATITTVQQAPTPPTNGLNTLLQNLPNFGSLFGFDHRLKTLEDNFSEFVQTNQFAGAISSILRIVQRYMDQRMSEAFKVAIQIQSDRLRDEAQTDNEEFLKNLDKNIQKIIKEQAEVLTRSSNSSKTSYAIAADLSKMELKKILIEKMEGNKSIHRSNEQRNLYKALVEAYESDKIILDTYRDTVTLKRRRDDDADKDEEPSTGSDRGSKRRREGKDRVSKRSKGESYQERWQTTQEMEEPLHPEFKRGADDQPITEPSQHLEWFSQQKKPPTPDRAYNKTFLTTHESIQPWISKLAKQTDSRSSFNELMDTPVDFLAFLMNRLKVETLTPELLAGLTYELMKGSCKSLVELEFFLEEVYKATTDQLDWINSEGQQYPHNLLKPLPLIPNSRGRRVIPFDHLINNDLEYLHGGALSRKYTTPVTKTKATDYGHIKWIEDLVPQTMESARDVYSKHRIIAVTELKIVEWHNYKHLDWITVRRDDDKLYKFKEGDFKRLRIQDIEDVRVEDLQLGVESYQKKLNLTRPDTYRSDLKRKEAYTAYSNQKGFIYQNKDKQNRLMRIDELHKFSDGTLTNVRTALDDRLKGIQMKYLPTTIWRKSDKERATARSRLLINS
nr:hypothetical protein [Tanacetum cinerariifolium]